MDIDKLSDKILKHKILYDRGEPIISDSEYDRLEDKLRDLDPNHPVLHVIGTGGDVLHEPPMLSCLKMKTIQEVIKWSKEYSLFTGYKVDGLSLALEFKDGKLIQASTRGDGEKGEDVTLNVLKIPHIPKIIPYKESVEIRGELYLPISAFNKINKEGNYSNPRNLAIGIIRRKEISETADKHLQLLKFMAWGVEHFKEENSIQENVSALEEWGFVSSDFKYLEPDLSSIEPFFRSIESQRKENKLDFEIDGIVFKYNSATVRNKAGVTSKYPKWQCALKFETSAEQTTLKGITWQISRTGNLTPVAELEEVILLGSKVRRATLNNKNFLNELKLNIGDTLLVEKAGDVIPRVVSVIEKKSSDTSPVPTICPICGSDTIEEKIELRCSNINCEGRILKIIEYWIKITDIKGLGPKSIEKLFTKKVLRNYSDLYSLTEGQLTTILGKNGSKIYKNIQQTLNLPFHTFLAALGIDSLGIIMSKTLANYYSTLEELKKTTIEELTEIEGISDITAKHILDGINNQEERYQKLFDNGLTIVYINESKKINKKSKKAIKVNKKGLNSFFNGNKGNKDISTSQPKDKKKNMEHENLQRTSVLVTGKISDLSRKEVKDLLLENNFEIKSSVSKNLGVLVIGEKAGGSKITKAESLNVPIMEWTEFRAKYKF